MKTVFDIVVDDVVVATLPTYDQAYEYALQNCLEAYTIVERSYSLVKGLGRDPDLH